MPKKVTCSVSKIRGKISFDACKYWNEVQHIAH